MFIFFWQLEQAFCIDILFNLVSWCCLLRANKNITVVYYGAKSWFAYLKIFQVCRLQSALIFSILNHPCSVMVRYYLFVCLFVCFFILVNYYFRVSFNLKVILYVTKITQNAVTGFLKGSWPISR